MRVDVRDASMQRSCDNAWSMSLHMRHPHQVPPWHHAVHICHTAPMWAGTCLAMCTKPDTTCQAVVLKDNTRCCIKSALTALEMNAVCASAGKEFTAERVSESASVRPQAWLQAQMPWMTGGAVHGPALH